jgi:hypothetical protein
VRIGTGKAVEVLSASPDREGPKHALHHLSVERVADQSLGTGQLTANSKGVA